MELRHLRYFVAVAEELNFTRAAERLYTSQPSLSEQIRNLEEEIGYPLLNRTRRKVELTEAGAVFLDDAREILQKVDEAVIRAGKAASQAREVLTIGFVPAAEVRIFPAVLPAFRAAFPQVDVVLRSLTSNEQEGAMARGELDLIETLHPFIDPIAKEKGIDWFASPWDTEAVAFLEKFDVPAHKVASASLTDDELLRALRGHPLLTRILETEPEALVTYTFQRLGSSQRAALDLVARGDDLPDGAHHLRDLGLDVGVLARPR